MKRRLSILLLAVVAITSSTAEAKTRKAHYLKPSQLVCIPERQAKEKIEKRPTGVNRSWEFLNFEFAQRLNFVLDRMKEEGYEMTMLEGYRSPERQNELMNFGGGVTQAKGFQSYHQFGLAADMAFVKNGKPYMNLKDKAVMAGYKRYGELAAEQGLVWGGKWTMQDYGHVELQAPRVFKLAKNYPDSKHQLIAMINTTVRVN